MAPEVARRQPVTNRPAVDCYGVGCIFHDLAHINTGVEEQVAEESPYSSGVTSAVAHTDATSNMVVIIVRRAIQNFEPCIAPGVPVALAALLRNLLAVDPAGRPSAEEARKCLAGLAAASVTWARGGGPGESRLGGSGGGGTGSTASALTVGEA